jgi:catechol 2,3-dioxygenase-like lactoylglutathione lyase family enzyme
MSPIPGVRRLDHVGITVPDLGQAHDFLVGVLGAEYRYRLDSRTGSDSWMSTHLGVDDAAAIREIRFYRLPGGAVVEVFDYAAPNQVRVPPRNSDIGGHHLAFYVDDLDAAVAYLEAAEVTVMGTPTVSGGGHVGQRWVYFLAPWGLQCELVSYPEGRPVDRDPAPYH